MDRYLTRNIYLTKHIAKEPSGFKAAAFCEKSISTRKTLESFNSHYLKARNIVFKYVAYLILLYLNNFHLGLFG